MGCFSREDVAEITGNIRTADSILYSYKKKKMVASVRRNLFTAINLETGESVCSHYQIASFIAEDSYISHHSAFEYYGMANQVFSQVYVSSKSNFNDFEFEGKQYKRIVSKTNEGISVFGKVRVTDIERTIVDSIKDFAKIGGLEELLRCLAMVTYVSEEKLVRYLQIYDSCILWQKAGYIMSHYPNLKISKAFVELCRKNGGKSIRYLYEDLKLEKAIYLKEWGLFVPENMMKLIDEGGEVFV
jgi:predicted transcriptional regulator of viral defense system